MKPSPGPGAALDPRAIRAVAFDLDGTLVDSLPDLADAAAAMLARLGRPPVDEARVRGFVGDGVSRLVERLLAGSREGVADSAEAARGIQLFTEHYAAHLSRRSRPYPGVADGLRRLAAAGFGLACVTNKPERFAAALLSSLDLHHHLAVLVGGDTLAARKPRPEPLLHTAARLEVQPGALLMVGDSEVDVRCARAAGCPVACVPYGYRPSGPADALGADAIVPSIDALALALLEGGAAFPPAATLAPAAITVP
jgi:phosphoglycolate phosphatase